MPASQAQDVRRGRLLQGFFWGGVGLAVLAMLALLFSQSVMVLRVAVILCVIAIMLLAISIVLRPSVDMVRVDIEEHIIGEVERVRLRARDDISTAARNTHRVLSEKIYALTATVEALRTQLEEVRVSSMLSAASPAPHMGQPSATGVVHRTETVQVTRRTTTVDPGDEAGRGTVYGSRSAVDGEWSEDRGEDRGGPRRHAAPEADRPPARPSEGYAEADWEATFRSLSRGQSALPASPGRPATWYTEDRGEDEWTRSRGRERESRHDREPEYGRHSERHHGRDQERESDRREPDRGRDRDYDRERGHDRGYDRDRGHDHDRDRGYERDRDRGYERDREPDAYRDRYRDHEPRHDRERGRERHHEPDRRHDRGRDHEREREYDRERHHRERESDHDHDRRGGRSREPNRDFDAYLDGFAQSYDPAALPRPRSPSEWER